MYALVNDMKTRNEDFEFYPTTDEIVFHLIRNLKVCSKNFSYSKRFSFTSFLDIGAGTGKVLSAIGKEFPHISRYAIEKSNTLKQLLEQAVYIVGTDFHEQTLFDKTMSVTFCNPPYSEFKKWSVKIIRESCSRYVYLVIPTRWKEAPEIQDAISFRNAETKVLGEFTFQNADRTSRAVVNLVRFDLSDNTDDAFECFFNEEFAELKEKFDNLQTESDEQPGEEKPHKFAGLVVGQDYVKNLVQMYDNEIAQIKKNYLYVKELDAELLSEFDVQPSKILTLLKERLKNLKNQYWQELLSRMEKITDRLITKKRRELFETLNANAHVDFTETNIYAIVLWILNNAEKYIDEQLLSIYEELLSRANCRNYKSNEKVYEGNRWRYLEEKPTHIFLDFRLVLDYWKVLDYGYSGNGARLEETACEYLTDLLTVGNNLGFTCHTSDHRLYRWADYGTWQAGKPRTFEYFTKEGPKVLFEVKAHKNGNLHIRLNQDFARALNVEYGRLKGWIHSGTEAAEEMNDSKAAQFFKCNLSLLTSPFEAIEYQPSIRKPKLSTVYADEKFTQESLTLS